MTIFITSDPHVGHEKVAEIRGFASANEWDDYLADYWDSTVTKYDLVFVLGDTGMSRFETHVLPFFDQRPGRKFLVTGNHDPVHPARSDAWKLQPRWLQTFEVVTPYLTRKWGGIRFLMSHFPSISWGDGPERGGEESSRWNEWRLPNSAWAGGFLLSGHTHGTEKGHGREYHVGLDAHGLEFITSETVVEYAQSFLAQTS